MKLVVELEDFGYLLDGDFDETITKEDLAERILEELKDQLMGAILLNSGILQSIVDECINSILKEHKDEIVSKVVEKTTKNIEKKKTLMENTPKKKDFDAIDKEWKKYFESIIDKCLAKKFK